MGQPARHAGCRCDRCISNAAGRNLPRPISDPYCAPIGASTIPRTRRVLGGDQRVLHDRLYRILRARIVGPFSHYPLESLKHDKAALKIALDRIGTLTLDGYPS